MTTQPNPTPNEQEPDKAPPFEFGDALQYRCDDRENDNVLRIYTGGNGDWYVSIGPRSHPWHPNNVRLCTSGGASAHCHGLTLAVSQAYRAMLASLGQRFGAERADSIPAGATNFDEFEMRASRPSPLGCEHPGCTEPEEMHRTGAGWQGTGRCVGHRAPESGRGEKR